MFFGAEVVITRQHKWVTKMHGYDYKIVYKKGKENAVADALSQKYEEGSLLALSLLVPDWLIEDQRLYGSTHPQDSRGPQSI